jgi:hypothetical protein
VPAFGKPRTARAPSSRQCTPRQHELLRRAAKRDSCSTWSARLQRGPSQQRSHALAPIQCCEPHRRKEHQVPLRHLRPTSRRSVPAQRFARSFSLRSAAHSHGSGPHQVSRGLASLKRFGKRGDPFVAIAATAAPAELPKPPLGGGLHWRFRSPSEPPRSRSRSRRTSGGYRRSSEGRSRPARPVRSRASPAVRGPGRPASAHLTFVAASRHEVAAVKPRSSTAVVKTRTCPASCAAAYL